MQLVLPNLMYKCFTIGNPFGIKRSKVKVTGHKNITGVGLSALVSDGFFWLKSGKGKFLSVL